MRMLNEIYEDLKKNVSFYHYIMNQIVEEEPKRRLTTLVNYWNEIIHTLEAGDVQYNSKAPNVLQYGFRPQSK